MKYVIGFIVGGALMSAVTRPARLKAFKDAYAATASGKAAAEGK